MTQSERERWRDCEAKKIGEKDTVNRFLRNNEICKFFTFHYIQCIVSSELNDLSPNARLSLSTQYTMCVCCDANQNSAVDNCSHTSIYIDNFLWLDVVE